MPLYKYVKHRHDPIKTAIFLTTRIVPLLLGLSFCLIGCLTPPPNLRQAIFFDNRAIYALMYVSAGVPNIIAGIRKSTSTWPVFWAVPATLLICAIRSIAILLNGATLTWQQQVTGVLTWTLVAFLKLAVAFSTISWTAMKREGRI